jgi:hypothetical protein
LARKVRESGACVLKAAAEREDEEGEGNHITGSHQGSGKRDQEGERGGPGGGVIEVRREGRRKGKISHVRSCKKKKSSARSISNEYIA